MKKNIKKQIGFYLALIILTIGIVQCNKDEESNPPTMSVSEPSESNPTAYLGEYVQLTLKASADASNGASLSKIEVKRKFEDEGAHIPIELALSGSSYDFDELIQVEDQEGTEVWTITLTDDQGKQAVKMLTITIQGAAPELAPLLSFAGPPAQNNDFTIDINSAFVIGVVANSNSQSGAELDKFIIKKAVGTTGSQTILSMAISGNVFTWDTTFFSNYQPAVETYTFRVVDVNGEFIERNIIATVVQADLGIFVFSGKHVGSNESTVGGGFSTVTGEVYDIAQVAEEQEADVDFVFLRSDNFGYSFMSPENPLIWGAYPAINGWTTQNKTMFEKTDLNVGNYNDIENKNQLILTIQNLAGISSFSVNYFSEMLSNPGGFEVNDIIAFENPNGNRGLMLIKEIDDGASPAQSTIIFDMKVEKP